VIAAPESAVAQAYRQTARALAAQLALRPRASIPIASSLI
jgi:ATP-binding protein involved in chromosome partitioning